jgi:signal transduction histidine kinase
VELVASVLAATAALEVFAALTFALAFVRRPAEREYGLAALLAVAAAVHAVGALVATQSHGAEAVAAERVAFLGLTAAIALAVHFAMEYRLARPAWRAVVVPYATAGLLAILDVLGWLGPRGATASAGAGAMVAYGTVGAGAGAVLLLTSRAYLAGRREAIAIVIGTTVLLASILNELGMAGGALRTGHLVDAGLLAQVLGIASMPSARYAALARELEQRTGELRTRTRELRRSYEDLRTAQEELVKKEQLAVVGELAAVIAHEVRNPLAIIANAVSGLRKTGISRDDHDTLLGILDEETSRLNRLVSDLLRYARPVNVQRSQIALGDLLERARHNATTPQKSIRSALELECHEPRVWGDANLLRQVFDNLIDNAVQAMGSAGALTIRARAVAEEGVDGIAVDIVDTGEGMDTQVRSRARDPFFTTRPSGTGLGLAIVDRIVEAHGGRLSIESRAGEGTTVTVFLPHGSPSEPPARPRPRTPSEPGHGGRTVGSNPRPPE